jgi:hypothetical protein
MFIRALIACSGIDEYTQRNGFDINASLGNNR